MTFNAVVTDYSIQLIVFFWMGWNKHLFSTCLGAPSSLDSETLGKSMPDLVSYPHWLPLMRCAEWLIRTKYRYIHTYPQILNLKDKTAAGGSVAEADKTSSNHEYHRASCSSHWDFSQYCYFAWNLCMINMTFIESLQIPGVVWNIIKNNEICLKTCNLVFFVLLSILISPLKPNFPDGSSQMNSTNISCNMKHNHIFFLTADTTGVSDDNRWQYCQNFHYVQNVQS